MEEGRVILLSFLLPRPACLLPALPSCSPSSSSSLYLTLPVTEKYWMAHKKKREENGARGSRRDVSDEWRGGMCRTILTRTNWFLGATRKSFGGGGSRWSKKKNGGIFHSQHLRRCRERHVDKGEEKKRRLKADWVSSRDIHFGKRNWLYWCI